MKIINLPVNLPNGTKCTVSGEVEHNFKNGYEVVTITHKNGKKYFNNSILKSHISSVMIENHLKSNNNVKTKKQSSR